jgi:hypothetical protein
VVYHLTGIAAFGIAAVKYIVRWSRQATDALTELWLANPELRSSITLAAAEIDQFLSANPHDEGESRGENNRILFVPPWLWTTSSMS